MICQPGGELLLRQGAEVLQCGAPEHFVEAGRVGRDLLRVELRRKAPEQRLKGRLGGRAEDDCGVIMLDELGDGTDAGGKVVAREVCASSKMMTLSAMLWSLRQRLLRLA